MVFPYPKGLIVIKKILHIFLVYMLWFFCIQSLVLNKWYQSTFLEDNAFIRGMECKVAREVVGGPRWCIVIIVELIQCKVDKVHYIIK